MEASLVLSIARTTQRNLSQKKKKNPNPNKQTNNKNPRTINFKKDKPDNHKQAKHSGACLQFLNLVGKGRRTAKKFNIILGYTDSPDLRIHETLFQGKEEEGRDYNVINSRGRNTRIRSRLVWACLGGGGRVLL